MYARLIFRNAKRSVKDYFIYIVTMTICVTLFYSFLSISSSYYRPDIGSAYDFAMLSDGLRTAICILTLLLLFLIQFVNHYMLLRRQKELLLFTADFDNQTIFYIAHPVRCAINLHKNIGLIL